MYVQIHVYIVDHYIVFSIIKQNVCSCTFSKDLNIFKTFGKRKSVSSVHSTFIMT